MIPIPHGFGVALIDFTFFALCAYFASIHYRPAEYWRWVWFVLFTLLSLLYFLAWLADLGAHI